MVRDEGSSQRIPSSELTLGDVVVLESGERVSKQVGQHHDGSARGHQSVSQSMAGYRWCCNLIYSPPDVVRTSLCKAWSAPITTCWAGCLLVCLSVCQVPADLRILSSEGLKVDNSSFTGRSRIAAVVRASRHADMTALLVPGLRCWL